MRLVKIEHSEPLELFECRCYKCGKVLGKIPRNSCASLRCFTCKKNYIFEMDDGGSMLLTPCEEAASDANHEAVSV